MKLNFMERMMTNSPVRAYLHWRVEGPVLKSFAQKQKYPNCLELGAGVGRGSQVILKFFGAEKVTAVDIDPAQLGRAKKRLSGKGLLGKVELKTESAMKLDEADNTYDAVFAFGVIHHMEDWRAALREIRRVLKPGGEYFFDELLSGFLKSLPVRLTTDHPEGGRFTALEFLDYLNGINLRHAVHRVYANFWLLGSAVKEG